MIWNINKEFLPLLKQIKKLRDMKYEEKVIKNAVNALKRLKKDYEGNKDYKPRVIIYENGYEVMMHCNYGSPQNISFREKRYKNDMGQKLIDHTFISKIDKLIIENNI